MNVIILGDLHIGAGLSLGKTEIGSNINSRINDQLVLLDWVLDRAIHLDVTDIIITGDIFEDPKPFHNLIIFFLSWLKKCESYSVNVHIIMGNHDFLRTGNTYSSPLDLISECDLNGIYVYKDIDTIIINKSAFTLVPFRDRKSFHSKSNLEALDLLKDSFVYELSSIPVTYKKIMIGHLAIEGSIPVGNEIEDIANELICPLNMFNGYDYVWMGHIHKPQIISKLPHIAHIGSMDISNFGEIDHKKEIVIFNSNTGEFECEIIPTRILQKISITIPKDTIDTTKYVIDNLKSKNIDFNNCIIKIEILLNSPDLLSIKRNEVEKFLLEQNVFYITNISETRKNILIKKDENYSVQSDMDLTSLIKKYCETNIEEKNKNLFLELSTDICNEYKKVGNL